MKYYEQFISKKDVERIHENVVRIFENVGVVFENQRALDTFKEHGARVEGNKVFIPRNMLEEAVKTAPETFQIHANTVGDATLGGGSMLAGGIGGNIYIQDGGRVRKMTNRDVVDQFKLNETSPVTQYGLVNPFMETTGFSSDQKIYGRMAFALKYSSKYRFSVNCITDGVEADQVYDKVKKGIQLVRDFEGIQDKPVIMEGINPLSPLAFDNAPIEKLYANCHEGQALWFTPCSMPLLTGPPSVAGLLSTTTAEALAGLVLAQLVRPGTPVVFGNTSASTNMRTIQLCIGSPEATLIAYATAAMADFYKLPFRNGGALSDAKDVDFQAGAESMMLLQATLASKPDYILHMCGVLGTFNIVSFEKFLLDEEIIAMVQRQLAGITVDDNTLSYDMIEKVGARGNYLQGRTPKMFRQEYQMAKLFNKEDPNQWQKEGSISVRENAREKVMDRLESYQAPTLEKEQLELIEKYIPAAFKDSIKF
ncbi:trimethylamine methyltransferase family protein [Alkalibacter rhizosphaerae]|uniref:Trimethylamine methyltransferase family protein n=1 Tax=Alkalibacter rhizosphaerae TaxID=2815577 RepID=A0A975AHJ9_9FIRM|nr:trimethylamine methyltransferase family protein [Alkalibacter rhizosphaerae]QSX08093.1 trimethylamine methyltransferase family protein [Alkalibacter rhizosphaerae]